MANRKSLFGLVKRECCNYESDKCLGIYLVIRDLRKKGGVEWHSILLNFKEVLFTTNCLLLFCLNENKKFLLSCLLSPVFTCQVYKKYTLSVVNNPKKP